MCVCLCIYCMHELFCGVPQGMSSVYFNKGENCIAAGRLFVEDSVHDEFISRVVREGQRSEGTPDMMGLQIQEWAIILAKGPHWVLELCDKFLCQGLCEPNSVVQRATRGPRTLVCPPLV